MWRRRTSPPHARLCRTRGRSCSLASWALQRLKELHELSFLLSSEAQVEERIVVIDHREKVRGSTVVKVRRVLPGATQWRGPIHPRRASGGVLDIRANLGGKMQERRGLIRSHDVGVG